MVTFTFCVPQSGLLLPLQSSSLHIPKTRIAKSGHRVFPMIQFGGTGIGRQLRSHVTRVQKTTQNEISTLETPEGEEERLKLDAEAMKAMAEVAESQVEEEDNAPGAWKWAIRKLVWDILESKNLAQDPRPVHHRIPNFLGAGAAAGKLASLPAFQTAQCVKVNPDTPQKQVRFLTLDGGKTLLTPQPRLRTGFFSTLESSTIPNIQEACSSMGVAKYGKPVGLDDNLKVDLLVIGSVAVDPATGARLGKGEGFAELEYGILRWMGAIDDSTLVVTTVHDEQLVPNIPVEKLLIHDVPVDVICTPTQIIHTNTKIPKPTGIYWDKLSRQKLEQIRVLRDLKKRIEGETGQSLPSGPDETLPALAARNKSPQKPQKTQKTRKPTQKITQENAPRSTKPTMFMWNIPPSATWRQLQEHVVKLGGDVTKVRMSKKPGNTRQLAWVLLKENAEVEKLVEAVNTTSLHGVTMRAKVDEPKINQPSADTGKSKAQDTDSPPTTV